MKGNRSQAHLSSQKVLGEGGLGRKGVGECFSHQNEWENCETVLRVFFSGLLCAMKMNRTLPRALRKRLSTKSFHQRQSDILLFSLNIAISDKK